jgi:hypothetical protein
MKKPGWFEFIISASDALYQADLVSRSRGEELPASVQKARELLRKVRQEIETGGKRETAMKP